MVKVKRDDIKEELEEQEEEVYGDASVGGHRKGLEEDDDVDEMYKKVYGNLPRNETIAEAIESDEKSRRGWKKNDKIIVETNEPDERIERIGETSKIDHLDEDGYSE